MTEPHVSIVTPDHVDLDFELAGIGSRLLALVADLALIAAALLALVLTLLLAGFTGLLGTLQGAGSWLVAVLVLTAFLTIWGYFVVFEARWRGRTPGKRWVGIRVVGLDGVPIGWREAALRNLVRFADVQPFPACLVGGLAIMLSRRDQRLGDLLAGTMVVRETFGFETAGDASGWEEAWVARVEAGRSRQGIVLADTRVTAQQLRVVERFLDRCESLPWEQRETLAWRIASPLLAAAGEDSAALETRPDRTAVCERVLRDLLARAVESRPAGAASPDETRQKRAQWSAFDQAVTTLHDEGAAGLRRMDPDALADFIRDYRTLTCDLARARSMGRHSRLVRRLNSVAVRAHNILYGHARHRAGQAGSWVSSFPRAVRAHWRAVAVSAAMFFGPAVVSYVAVQLHPEIGYDLVSDGFLDFEPAREESIHAFPSVVRPVVASAIVANNVQVTLFTFGLGLTAGIGSALLLVFNGVHLGAVAGWMSANGNGRALWGWVLPHGGTELTAIVLSGAAGFALAHAIIAPGDVRRAVALRRVAMSALVVELGVMGMLVVAALIEGFLSPSAIGFGARVAVFLGTVVFWLGYLSLAGLVVPSRDGRGGVA